MWMLKSIDLPPTPFHNDGGKIIKFEAHNPEVQGIEDGVETTPSES